MSISINNFFADLYDTVECSSPVNFTVDVTDSVHNITTSGTYFIYNGTVVSGTYTTISGGYTVGYTTTPSGNVDLQLRAHNTNDQITTRSYEFHFGYTVDWHEVVNWKNDRLVPVFVIAENNTVAPSTMYYSTYFTTRALMEANLNMELDLFGSGAGHLEAAIAPQSKYLEYGKTYTITIEGIKDYSGNVMAPQTFTFTIEDEN